MDKTSFHWILSPCTKVSKLKNFLVCVLIRDFIVKKVSTRERIR